MQARAGKRNVVTSGGRVLAVTALGDDGPKARARAYEAVKKIHFDKLSLPARHCSCRFPGYVWPFLMLRRIFLLLGLICCAHGNAAPTSTPASTPALIDSLSPADLEQVLPLLRKNFINPAALSQTDVDRATLQGLMLRLGQGVDLLPNRVAEQVEPVSPFYQEVLAGHIGYLRLGSLTSSNLKSMDAALQQFAGQKSGRARPGFAG